jgi:hypothetical protein
VSDSLGALKLALERLLVGTRDGADQLEGDFVAILVCGQVDDAEPASPEFAP